MKSRLSTLIRKELLLYYGMRNAKKEPNPARFLLVLLIAVGMAPAFFVYVNALREIHRVFAMINQIPSYFMSAFIVAQIFLLFTGIPAFLGRFYGNKDNPILLPMPIETGDLLVSRFVPVFLMQAVTALVFIVPAIIVHANRMAMDLSAWAAVLTGSVASIIFPTVLSAALVLVIMRYTGFGRHADKWKTIGVLFMLVLLIGFQAVMQSYAQNNLSENFLMELLTDNQALIRNTATFFLPARWTGMGIAQGDGMGWLYSGLNLILAFLSGWFLQWLGTRVYLHSVLTGTEVAKEKKKTGEKLRVKERHPIAQILLHEWRILVRTPAFAVNVLSTPLIVSVIWLIPLFMNREIIAEAAQLESTLGQLQLPGYFYILAAVAAGALMGVFLSLFVETSTSFSREGKAFWVRRVLPIEPSHEVMGRALLNVILTMVTASVFLILSYVFFRYPIEFIPVALLSAGFFSIPLTLAGLLIDVHRPKQDWDDPNQAVKQNLNSLFAMLASIAYIIIFAGIGYLLVKNVAELSSLLLTGTLAFVLTNLFLSVVLYWVLVKRMPKAIARME